ncbi:DUF4394 domain-containing protein [Hymenobacter terricola]|uniref:DUF4394 domain-containing protein n=2 Tax=Hymenobacter terricola TaxID=2819236 RepID=UPI001CF50C9B|nr:DUF4394 domain-containing protein [Hymenobacter terricola]
MATRQGICRLLGAALSAGLLLAAPVANAQTIYGLGTVPPNNVGQPVGVQGLIIITPATGATNTFSPAPITGITVGQTIVGIDSRPNTGQLFALGYDASLAAPTANAQVYILDPATSVLTAVGAAIRLELGSVSDRIGFDFNPTVDRIRVVSTNDRNYRLNPVTGGIAATDGNLAYTGGAPADPGIGAVAYTNSYIGSTSTTLYDFDELNTTSATTPGNTAILSIQNPPNNGVLTSPVDVLFNGIVTGSPQAVDIDIYYNATTGLNEAYLTEVTPGGSSNFYALNLATGAATLRGNTIPSVVPFQIRDIAVAIAPPTQPALTGLLMYAVAGGNLVSFDSGAPGNIRSAVNFGGGLAAGQTVVGIDFRPATAQLYALGYNPATTAASIYTVNLTTGNLTAVGTTPNLALGAANAAGTPAERIGFDFNPTVDRIRVVATNGANYRLNPNDGTLTATDTNLSGTGVGAAAYTNNQSNANATALYDYDATTGTLYLQNPPNNGTLVSQGNSGLTAAAADGADFDIFNTPSTTTNQALLAVNTDGTAGRTTFDNLYSINLTNGAATNLGTIGFGTNVSGLSAFIQAGTLLTWNGSVSTDWNAAANWTPAQVPTTNNDVVIPSGTPNQPTVSASNGIGKQARNVTLNSGAVLTLADNGVLLVGGNFTNNSGSVAASGAQGNGRVTLTTAGPHTLAGTLTTFPILVVNGAATLGGPVSISKGLRLTGSLTSTGQTLTLLSSAAGTAYVFNSGGVIVGSVTAQRYIAPSLNSGVGYRHYSSPVSGNTVADFATAGYSPEVSQAAAYNGAADPTQVSITPFPTILKYNETRVTTNVPANGSRDFDRGYEVPASTAEALETARGYTVNIASSALVDFTGTANDGTTPISVSGLTRGGLPQSGWHLRGNPFPSPLDWQRMVSNSRLSGVDNALYVFKSSGQYTGSYASYINGVGTNGGTNSLPVGQGFFVRTSTAGTSGSLTFTNAERDTATTALFQRGTAETRTLLALTLRNATAATQASMYFDQGATTAFDRAFDAYSLPAPNGLTFATEAGTAEVAINGQPLLTGADVLLPLHLGVATAGTYTLAVDELLNLPTNYHAYLRDALTGAYTDLATTPALSLSLAANGAAGGRYAVLFTTRNRVLATAPAALAQLASVYPNPAHATAALLLPVALRGNRATGVSVLDNLGRVVLTRTLPAGATDVLELPLAALAPGVYSVLAHTQAGLVAKRLVVQ